jgi:hypothetical protein
MPWGLPGYPFTVYTIWPFMYVWAQLQAEQRRERQWEALAASYPDRLEQLEVLFGRHLRAHYPQVRSAYSPGRLEFRDGRGARLVLELAEPVRTPWGWGGASLAVERPDGPVALAFPELFLTLLRGRDPEWVARPRPGRWRLVHRFALVDEAFVASVAQAAFGA